MYFYVGFHLLLTMASVSLHEQGIPNPGCFLLGFRV